MPPSCTCGHVLMAHDDEGVCHGQGCAHVAIERAGGVMSDRVTIIVDMDRRCSRCRKKGATQSGLCLKCITKAIIEGRFDHILKGGK